MEDIREFEIENLKKQNKNLKEMWNLINEELEVYNIVIGMSMSDEEFYERKKEAWKIYTQQKEEEDELMDYLENLSLSELFGFLEYRNSYKDMMESYADLVAEAEFKHELAREEEQLKYLEEKEKING